jgi:UDP-glucose 4-epimerase
VNISGKKVMVTGGAGFIGSHLSEYLVKLGVDKLIIVDNFSLGKDANIKHLYKLDNVEVYRADASDIKIMTTIFENHSIDVVFNLAVIPLPASLIDPKKIVDENVSITSTICELQRKDKFKTLINTSSSEAYGTAAYPKGMMDESHPTYPITPYAASKLASDHIALSYMKTFNLDTSIVRPFNTYGPRQNEKSYAGVIPLTISRILKGESPVIYGDGLQTRDYTYVEDIAKAIPKFYEEKSTRGKVINLASGKESTIKEIINKIMDVMNYNGTIIYLPSRPGDVRRHLGDISLAEKLIGYKPTIGFQDGIKKTVDWYKQNTALN